MADETTETNQDQSTETEASETATEQTEEKKFSQAEVDEMISKRLAKEKSAREREEARKEAERQKQAEIDALEGEAKLKAQYQADLDRVNSERDEAQRELRVARAGVMLGKVGLDTDFAEMMTGASDEETQANVDRFAKTVREEASKMVKASLNKGAPPVPEGGASHDADTLREKMRMYAGLPTKK